MLCYLTFFSSLLYIRLAFCFLFVYFSVCLIINLLLFLFVNCLAPMDNLSVFFIIRYYNYIIIFLEIDIDRNLMCFLYARKLFRPPTYKSTLCFPVSWSDRTVHNKQSISFSIPEINVTKKWKNEWMNKCGKKCIIWYGKLQKNVFCQTIKALSPPPPRA